VETPEVQMAELAERLVGFARDIVGYRGKVVKKTSQDGDYLIDNPNRRCPIILKAREHLGYNPTVTLDEGLRRSMIWYSGNREAEDS
jgi:nucleoside-diphosphate-sugar epimerase